MVISDNYISALQVIIPFGYGIINAIGFLFCGAPLILSLELLISMFLLVLLILPVLIWFYSHPLTLKLFQYLLANPPTVRGYVHLM